MDFSPKSSQKPSLQREAIQAWERRRRLQPVFAVAALLLVIIAWGLRRTMAGKVFLILGVLLIGAARGLQRDSHRCPVCGHFNAHNALTGRREFHCSICGFTYCDF